jgi:hypothetical protein
LAKNVLNLENNGFVAKKERSEDIKQMEEGHSLPGEHRQMDMSGHEKNLSE